MLAITLTASRARATEENPLGILFGFLLGLGLTGAVPIGVAGEPGAPLSLGFGLGVGGETDAFAIETNAEGFTAKGGWFGVSSRFRLDFLADGSTPDDAVVPNASMRFDFMGVGVIAGKSDGPVALSALVGTTIWPGLEDRDGDGDPTFHFGVGPTVGLRFDATSKYVRGRLEADYAPQFVDPYTGNTHHIDVGAELGIKPWADDEPVMFTLSLRREIAMGGDDPYWGQLIMAGMRVTLPTDDIVEPVEP